MVKDVHILALVADLGFDIEVHWRMAHVATCCRLPYRDRTCIYPVFEGQQLLKLYKGFEGPYHFCDFC